MPSLLSMLGVDLSVAPATGPPSISGLQFWWKADSITNKNTGDAIDSWFDSSKNSRSQSQATGTKQPLYRATDGPGGHPCVRFDGVDDEMRSPAFLFGSPFTIFTVFKCSSTSYVYQFDPDGVTSALYLSSSTVIDTILFEDSGTAGHQSGKLRAAGWASDSVWRYVTHQYNATHLSHKMWIGTVEQTMTTSGTENFDAVLTWTQPFSLGKGVFNGDIAECFGYNVALNATDLATAQSYLATKYGL